MRWGHRFRDQRVTTHVALVARAFGTSEFILTDIKDEEVRATVEKIVASWGGRFHFEMGKPWKLVVKKWRDNGGSIVHLTAYGENIETSDVLKRIKTCGKDVLVIVGSQKVPKEFYSPDVSDFNVAVGSQPHSEISSLAVFLDRFHEGKELAHEFKGARMRIMPQKSGKKVVKLGISLI
jgi:tRNA (cytidine56-2'-O)-methyltransferase